METSVLFANKGRCVSCCVLAIQIRNIQQTEACYCGLEPHFLSTDVEGILVAKLASFAETFMLSAVMTSANVYRTLCRNHNIRQ